MVIDFSKIKFDEPPVLVLRNIDGTPIQTLGYAFNLTAELNYNETSQIKFDVPAHVDGVKTPHYDDIVGTRIVDMVGIGQFILMKPSTSNNGIREIKSCTAYSLEYELTYKKMSLSENTYNFWNPVAPNETVIGIILSYLPSWSVGEIDDSLVGKYRTFSESNVNIYDFIKSTIQEKYGCIFEFDTYNRTISVRSTESIASVKPVYISTENLASAIEIEEDTENIITVLDVNGAEDVDIRSVNPMGTNKIYNLDYYINTGHLQDEMVDKWNAWKDTYHTKQLQYYNLTVERVLKTSAISAEEHAISELENAELAALENRRAVLIEQIATMQPGSDSYNEVSEELQDVNSKIATKESEISQKEAGLDRLRKEYNALTEELKKINEDTSLSAFFTKEEIVVLDRYFKEDSIEDSSFVLSQVKNYVDAGESRYLYDASVSVNDSSISLSKTNGSNDVYMANGGTITITGNNNLTANITANIVKLSFEKHTDNSFVLSGYLNSGTINTESFASGCISIAGKCENIETDSSIDGVVDAVLTGTCLSFRIPNYESSPSEGARLYFTKNTTEYEQFSVEWDLFEYGTQCLSKLCYPSFTFDVTTANFLAIEDFLAFSKALTLGEKIMLEISDGNAITPILVGVAIDFENVASLKLTFGDTYNLSNSSFELVDLLEQSISMGKTVDTSRFSYNSFIDSGASTAVREYMNSALDVSKNAILSGDNMAIEWNSSGMYFRKWNKDKTGYEPEQIAVINNNIVFTDDGWDSAKMAIGKFSDSNTRTSWGIVAPNIVGTLLAGENLVIESTKPDGENMAFKVDADGASLYNASFTIADAARKIVLNPAIGFAIGSSGLITEDDNGNQIFNKDCANFRVDPDGNVLIKGDLTGSNGTFSGVVKASDFLDSNGKSMLTDEGKFDSNYLDLGNIRLDGSTGNITLSGTITWDVDADSNPMTVASNALSAANSANSNAVSAAGMATRIANGTYTGGTFINQKTIYSPNIITDALNITAKTLNGTTYTDTNTGYINFKGTFNNKVYDVFRIKYYAASAPAAYLYSPVAGDLYMGYNPDGTSSNSRTNFFGHVDFANATVTGLNISTTSTAVFG